MNPQRHVYHLISDYIDGCLSPALARRLEVHVAECPACSRELMQWRAVLQLVSLHAAVPCPIDCAEAVLSRIEAADRELTAHPRTAWAPYRLTAPRGAAPDPALCTTGLSLSARFCRSLRLNWSALVVFALLLVGWTWLLSTSGTPEPAAGVQIVHPTPVRADPPERLDGAFGRNDSLILASDFVEEEQ